MEGELEFASVSLRALYREYMPSVYRMAFSYLHNHHDSEDVVQDCFLRLAQSGKHFHDPRQVQAWLIITAANLSKDMLRRSGRAVSMVENCCMASERCFRGVDAIPDDAGYFSLIIAKEKK